MYADRSFSAAAGQNGSRAKALQDEAAFQNSGMPQNAMMSVPNMAYGIIFRTLFLDCAFMTVRHYAGAASHQRCIMR